MTDPTPPDTGPEPSMEEILASIRQIISEDLASVAAADSRPAPVGPGPERPPGERDDDDVLILTERAPPEPSPFAPPPAEPAESVAPVQAAEPPPPEPSSQAEPPPQAGSGEAEPESGRSLALARSVEPAVVAPQTAAVVAASFERLALVVEKTSPPPFTVSHGGATLEDITREILTPVIKAWLDENLPAIVQARVDEEVERIARGRVR